MYLFDCLMLYFLILLFLYSYLNNFNLFFNFLIKYLSLIMSLFGFSSYYSFMIFYFVLISCFAGFFSYSICVFCLIKFTMFISFYFWIASFFYFISSFKFFLYLTKINDNYFKVMFFLGVEMISEFSRPFSLTVRLSVNILVGHSLCFLLFYIYEFYSFSLFNSLFCILMEFFVFLIQSYIFSRLIFMYLND